MSHQALVPLEKWRARLRTMRRQPGRSRFGRNRSACSCGSGSAFPGRRIGPGCPAHWAGSMCQCSTQPRQTPGHPAQAAAVLLLQTQNLINIVTTLASYGLCNASKDRCPRVDACLWIRMQGASQSEISTELSDRALPGVSSEQWKCWSLATSSHGHCLPRWPLHEHSQPLVCCNKSLAASRHAFIMGQWRHLGCSQEG